MLDYKIDYSAWSDEGGYCQVYPIKYFPDLIFKEFRSKKRASQSYKYHKQLEAFDLAPKIYSKVCRLQFAPDGDIIFNDPSDWGYIMERARVGSNKTITMKQIQRLVENITEKTGLKFWDCHWYNIGLIQRRGRQKVVCIDTGAESFDGNSNAWGNPDPGPKCSYCLKYNCLCED